MCIRDSKFPAYCLYLLIVGVVNASLSRSFGGFDMPLLNLFIAYLIITDAVSVIAHMQRLGIPVPDLLRRVLLRSKRKVERIQNDGGEIRHTPGGVQQLSLIHIFNGVVIDHPAGRERDPAFGSPPPVDVHILGGFKRVFGKEKVGKQRIRPAVFREEVYNGCLLYTSGRAIRQWWPRRIRRWRTPRPCPRKSNTRRP